MSEQSLGMTDEIELKEVLRRVLDTRLWVIIALIVATVAYWTIQMVINLALPTIHSYETRINLVFKGVQNGTYPNESPFSINDIIAPVVLNQVYKDDNLEPYIEQADFVGAFSIAPYTPDREFILKKYTSQLDGKNLSPAEITGLQTQLNDELKNAAKSSVGITFSSSKAGDIPELLINKVLQDVPAQWARHMIEDVGVTRFDKEIYTDKVVDLKLFESIDYLISFEMLLDRVSLLQENVEKIKAMPNGLVVVDDESGFSLPDLEKAVSDVKRYRIAPLINPVKSLGIAKNPEVVELYFDNELRTLNREKDTVLQKRKNIVDVYSAYVQNEAEAAGAPSGSGSGGLSTGSMIPQFSAEFLDRLVQMTNSGADIQYRQDLNKQLLAISNRLADQNAEIGRIQEILDSMNGTNDTTKELRQSYAEEVNKQLPLVVEQLKKYFQISDRLYDKLSREDLGTAGFMYKTADGDIEHSESRGILNFANLRLYLIICCLVAVLTVSVAMIRNAMRT